MVQVLHSSVKGRARYKVAGLYRSDSLRLYLEKRLTEKPEVSGFSVNILTGNIVVMFAQDGQPAAIAVLLKSIVNEYVALQRQHKSTQPTVVKSPLKPAPRQKPSVRARLKQLTGHTTDQKTSDWHLQEAREVVKTFETSRRHGLSAEAASVSLRRYGPNLLPESVPRSGLSMFVGQFKSLPVALLGVSAVLSAATGGLVDAALIVGVVMINAAIGYVTERQAERTIDSLKGLVRPMALVVRDGAQVEVKAEEVVPGDVLILRPGSYVAGDARLVHAERLSIDESALTGESMPVGKTTAAIKDRDIPLADRLNMVYMGTLVTGGQGLAVVVNTGRFTEIGRIQDLVGEAEAPETPMERQLRIMGGQLVLISGSVCGIVFVIGLLRGYGLLQMLKSSIALAVAAVPEGLPAVATMTLALGIGKMRKNRVLIRHLNAVETLGSVQTICLDKTGTITMNKMSVVEMCAGGRRIKVSCGAFTSAGGDVNPYQSEELLRLIHVSVICNESELSLVDGRYVLNGSPTENALVETALASGIDVAELRKRHPVTRINHRSENRNFMSTLHRLPGHRMFVAMKGSPVEVLAMCDWHVVDGKKRRLTDEDRLGIGIENERMAGAALRVLGLACCYVKEGEEGPEGINGGSLIWLGIVGMADPVRDGVKELMCVFHGAGIDTVMITGDQSPTAYAIGRELNLSGDRQLEILDSTHLTRLEPEALKALAGRAHVYARVSPANKLQIVQALQAAGKVVAMTGDGINDGPALKAADIGIALGKTGTDVAREVADIVLEDDELETMIIAVSHGRTIYNNIRKSVHYLLSTNLSEIMVMFFAISAGLGQPLNAMQLLWINLLSDIFPGLALALEPPEPDILNRPPRDPHEPIIKRSDFKRIAFESGVLSAGAFGAYGYGIARYGMGPRANTMAFASLTTAQLLHAYSCRSETISMFHGERLPENRYLHMAVGGSLALQVLAMAVPGIRGLLGMTPIGLIDGAVIAGTSLLPYVVNEATKKRPMQAPLPITDGRASEPHPEPPGQVSIQEADTYEAGFHVHVGVCDGRAS